MSRYYDDLALALAARHLGGTPPEETPPLKLSPEVGVVVRIRGAALELRIATPEGPLVYTAAKDPLLGVLVVRGGLRPATPEDLEEFKIPREEAVRVLALLREWGKTLLVGPLGFVLEGGGDYLTFWAAVKKVREKFTHPG
ncbi:hypothetical protein MN1_920 [Thermus phage MN1]|nr:hypothetical protein MN1_920 [Thermus phage MN1]